MGAKEDFIRNRVNMPTVRDSAGIAQIPTQIRARAFFSARVAEAHILDRFRQISDDYTTGKISRDEARHLLMQYARASGKDDGTASLKNLASVARLNLILDQNNKMAHAVGEHERMYSASAKEKFPYVRYRASVGSINPRSSHQKYDGLIFDKDDPWLRAHTPPWEFGCNCQLEQITAKEAGKTPGNIQPMTPANQVQVNSQSGYAFDPSQFFEEIPIPGSVSPLSKRGILAGMRKLVEQHKTPVAIAPSRFPAQPLATGVPAPQDIGDFLQQNKPILKNPQITKTDEKMRAVPQTLSMGIFTQEVIDEFGLAPGEEQILLSRGKSAYGLFHQQKGHDAEMWNGEMIRAIMETLQNKNVKYTMKMTPGKNNYINIEALDGSGYLTLIQKGANAHWEIVDAHCQASERYKNKFNRI